MPKLPRVLIAVLMLLSGVVAPSGVLAAGQVVLPIRTEAPAHLNRLNPKTLAGPAPAPVTKANESSGIVPPPGKLLRPTKMSMQPGVVNLDPLKPTQFLGSDGRFELDVPAGAVTAADLTTAAGDQLGVSVRQVAPASGSTGGGSGQYSFGSFIVQVVDGQKHEWNQALRKPVTFKLHASKREQAFDLNNVRLTFNGALPNDANFNPDPAGTPIPATQAHLSKASSMTASFDASNSVLVATAMMPSDPLVTFNTDSPDASFGKPDLFNADVSAGAISAGYPIGVPAGPGGLTPPINLTYSSADLNEQHNPQGAAGWAGEGWNLAMGSISWAEHNVAAGCQATGKCTSPNWKDSWELNDPYGTTAEIVPPNTQVTTYYDDTPYNITPTPVQWHTSPESHAKVWEYTGSFGLPGESVNPPCYRVFLRNGIMEEFGCSSDNGVQPLQYWPWTNTSNYAVNQWLLDLITDPQGNQIHLNYQVDTETFNNKSYPRDIVLSSIEWDDPTCHSAQTRCTTWNPLMRVYFAATHSVAHVSGSSCAANGNLRCDDPTSGPRVQSDFVLNDIQVQVRPSGSASWNTLRDYQLSYDQSTQTSITDPATGSSESVAGKLTLTQLIEIGDDGSTALPVRTFGYNNLTNWYTDEAYQANASAGCGPAWNTPCHLWSRSYGGNSYFLSSASNGLGLGQTFSYAWARNNTHGVNGGGSNAANPLYCSNLSASGQATYPCDEADSQNWSRMVLSSESGSVVQAGSTLTTTRQYSYTLAYPLAAQACSDCVAGYSWGNQKDGDYADYYNGKFMGFAQVTVTNPDSSVEVHKYHSTLGWGVYDCSQVSCAADNGSGTTYCYSACHNDPWWPLSGQSIVNALHGHEYEADYYDTNGSTLLKKTLTSYTTGPSGSLCLPSGVSGSPSNGYGNWDGQLVSELDPSNPVGVCDIQTSQSNDDTYDGSSASGIPDKTTSYSYDGYGRVTSETVTANDGNATGSATTIVNKPVYVFNDNVAASSTGATGTYLIDVQAFNDVEDSSGNRYSCTYTSYDGNPYATGQTSALTLGESTRVDRYTNCGTASNGFAASGQISESRTYDQYGNLLTTDDPDANAGNTSHLGCTIAGSATTYSQCNAYDGTFESLLVSQTNALNQTQSVTYQAPASATAATGFGLWPTSTIDVNGQTTSYTFDALGRLVTETLPGEPSGYWTDKFTYSVSCSGTGAQSPCLEIDRTQTLYYQQLCRTCQLQVTRVTSRSFYDGWEHLVESQDPSPTTAVVVRYRDYDSSGRLAFESVPYFVTNNTGTNYLAPDTTQPGASHAYDGIGRPTLSKDALSDQTTKSYGVGCGAISGDSTCYEQALTVDPLNHQSGVLMDALGREDYAQSYTGSGSATYAVYATTKYTYDYQRDVTQILQPDGATRTTFQYDNAGKQIAVTDPDLGSSTNSYDQDGNLTESVDARGSGGTVYRGYDGLDRPLWRNTANSATGAYATFTYDSTANGNIGVGRLTSETFEGGPNNSLSGSYSYVYDTRGRQKSTTLTIGNAGYTVTNYYNDAGDLTQQNYPDGESVTPGYDNTGWLTSLSTLSCQPYCTSTTLLNNVSYNENEAAGQFGGPGQQLTGASLGGGAYQYSATYDALLRATDLKWTNSAGTTTFFEQARTFDGASNVISANTTLPAGTDNQVFCYDAQNRLIGAASYGTPPCGLSLTPGSLSAAQYNQGFSYDNMGRLTGGPNYYPPYAGESTYYYGDSAHVHAATGITYPYNAGSIQAYSAIYDAAGDMICRDNATGKTGATNCLNGVNNGQQLTYDAERQLSSWQNAPTNPTSTASFLYDNQGNRVEQQVTQNGTTTTTIYISNLEEVATSGSTTTTTTYYYAGPMRVALAVNGVFYYLAADGLGTADVAIKASDSSTSAALYAPYGQGRYSSGTMPTDYGFTGQHADAVTGLDYYNARYYDSSAEQFESADNVLPGNGYDTWGLSRYAYVEGNPEARVDPSGNTFCYPDSPCSLNPEPALSSQGASVGTSQPSELPCEPFCSSPTASGSGVTGPTQINGLPLTLLSGSMAGILLERLAGALRAPNGPYGSRNGGRWRTLDLAVWEAPDGQRYLIAFQNGSRDYGLWPGTSDIVDVPLVTGYIVKPAPGMPANVNDAEEKMTRFTEVNGGKIVAFEVTRPTGICPGCREDLSTRLGIPPSQLGKYGWSNPTVEPKPWEDLIRGNDLGDGEGGATSAWPVFGDEH